MDTHPRSVRPRRSVAWILMAGVLSMSLWTVAGAQQLLAIGTLSLPNTTTTGVITFTGTPGQYVAITLQEGVNTDNNYISNLRITITAPDGSILSGPNVTMPPTPVWTSSCPGGCYGNSVTNLGPLKTYAQGTTYTVTVQATAMAGFGSGGGNIDYTIITPIVKTDPLVINGPAVPYYIGVQGQGMMIPVTLTAGREYSLTVSETNRNLPNLLGLILDANGHGVQGAGMFATCASPCTIHQVNQYSGSEASGIGVGTTGQYTLWLYQETQQSGLNAYGPLQGDFSIQITQIAP
jgi:hypothetical protein